MGWVIERDDNGYPVRMWWTDDKDVDGPIISTRPPLHFMPAVRDWARKHGLDPRTGLPDPEPCA